MVRQGGKETCFLVVSVQVSIVPLVLKFGECNAGMLLLLVVSMLFFVCYYLMLALEQRGATYISCSEPVAVGEVHPPNVT